MAKREDFQDDLMELKKNCSISRKIYETQSHTKPKMRCNEEINAIKKNQKRHIQKSAQKDKR